MCATMQLYLVLLALLQQTLCVHYPVDATELHLSLQTKPLNAWIESIAARKQISKDAVRSNVRAMRIYLGPESQSPNRTAAAEHAQLERRQPALGYPYEYGSEKRNDELTKKRIHEQSVHCRETMGQPVDSPYVPLDGIPSFWRAGRGNCIARSALIYCKLPKEFGPRGWDEHFYIRTSIPCATDEECETFNAYGFPEPPRLVKFGGCVTKKRTKKKTVVHNTPIWSDKIPAPMSPGTRNDWAIYGASEKHLTLDWAVFSGLANENLWTSYNTETFLYNRDVEWRGTDPDYPPWLKLSKIGSPVTISLYSHMGY